jgi:type IV pilus assembly protein PilY1
LTSNYLYMIKDRRTAVGSGVDSAVVHADFGDVTDNCLQSGDSSSCAISLASGWRLRLEDIGEKALATPLTLTGKVFFTTYLPQSGDADATTACAPSEGAGRLYAVSLQDATAVINYDSSDDDPGSSDPDAPNSKADRSVDLRSAGIPAGVVSIPPNKILRPDLQIDNVDTATRWRTYWYLQEDADL